MCLRRCPGGAAATRTADRRNTRALSRRRHEPRRRMKRVNKSSCRGIGTGNWSCRVKHRRSKHCGQRRNRKTSEGRTDGRFVSTGDDERDGGLRCPAVTIAASPKPCHGFFRLQIVGIVSYQHPESQEEKPRKAPAECPEPCKPPCLGLELELYRRPMLPKSTTLADVGQLEVQVHYAVVLVVHGGWTMHTSFTQLGGRSSPMTASRDPPSLLMTTAAGPSHSEQAIHRHHLSMRHTDSVLQLQLLPLPDLLERSSTLLTATSVLP